MHVTLVLTEILEPRSISQRSKAAKLGICVLELAAIFLGSQYLQSFLAENASWSTLDVGSLQPSQRTAGLYAHIDI